MSSRDDTDARRRPVARARPARERTARRPGVMAAPLALVAERERLGELLVREGLISREQLTRALDEQRTSGMRLGYCLVKLGAIGGWRASFRISRLRHAGFRIDRN